ncbi:MAG TPA: phytanoyl-CoA dioxygenase family protein [Blastocatellia bacterium]|nr:phytanoyl-CoA dioxygenase family protein [Blastocatellia bacterium]
MQPGQDLSIHHSPVSEFVVTPRSEAEWDEYRLSPEQIAFYRENGYLSGIPMLTGDQVALLLDELRELIDPRQSKHDLFYEFHSNESTDPNKVLFHALGAWRIAPGFHDLLWNPRFLGPASQLLDGSVRFWHDQLFCKPARHGGVVAWHQDYSYWTRTQPLAHLTCWIALDDSTRDNGCVQYVPGSHCWPDLPITGLAGNMDSIMTVLTEEQKKLFKPVAIELKAGQASFHHPRMIHGSYANETDRQRRATVINVFRDGVKSASNDPPLEGVPAIPAGQKMEGQFFPLLFESAG